MRMAPSPSLWLLRAGTGRGLFAKPCIVCDAVSFCMLLLRIYGVRRNLCKEKDFSIKIDKAEGILMRKFLACFLSVLPYSSIFVITVI